MQTIIQPCMWFLHDGTGGKAPCCLTHGELARVFHEPHTGLDDCLNMLLSCFRTRTSGYRRRRKRRQHSQHPPGGRQCCRGLEWRRGHGRRHPGIGPRRGNSTVVAETTAAECGKINKTLPYRVVHLVEHDLCRHFKKSCALV